MGSAMSNSSSQQPYHMTVAPTKYGPYHTHNAGVAMRSPRGFGRIGRPIIGYQLHHDIYWLSDRLPRKKCFQ